MYNYFDLSPFSDYGLLLEIVCNTSILYKMCMRSEKISNEHLMSRPQVGRASPDLLYATEREMQSADLESMWSVKVIGEVSF